VTETPKWQRTGAAPRSSAGRTRVPSDNNGPPAKASNAGNGSEVNRFRDLLEVAQQAAHFGYWTFDYTLTQNDPSASWGDAFFYSPELVAVSGLTPEETAKMSTQQMADRYVRPEDRAVFISNLTAFASGQIDHYRTEYVWYHPDGKEITVCSTGIRHRGPNGEPLQATGIVQDLTERRASERAIREQADALRKAELTLIQAQKGEALGNLAGGIAHDIHNALAIINGYVDLSLRHLDDPAKVSLHLGKIKESIAAGKKIVAQILAFSRKTDQVLTVIDVQRVIDSTVTLLQHSLPADIYIDNKRLANGLYANANENLLQQAIVNLCNNAAQAMLTGGRIEVRLDRLHVERPISAPGGDLAPGDYVALYVEDTGVGIPPELGTSIFDPFVTTKSANQGTGLGLAIVQKTIRSFGGIVDFKSREGVGTTFRVLLPLATGDPLAVPPPDGESPGKLPLGSGQRILFLDDEVALVETGGQLLSELHYQVTTSTDPRNALEVMRKDPGAFDLIVTDLKMPHMAGQKFIAEVLAIRPDMRFIVVSGYGELRLHDAAVRGAVRSILEKPVDIETLARALADALRS
jgi:PAS domain S-box-containing protein